MNINVWIFILVISIISIIYSFSILDKDFEYANEQFLQALLFSKVFKRMSKKNKEKLKKTRKFSIFFLVSCIVLIISINKIF